MTLRNFTFMMGIFFIMPISQIKSQATIGSQYEPNKGAILDLKQNTNTSESNSSKGLGLPRVKLTNLRPTTPAQLSASIGATGDWELDKHTALTVYNVEPNYCAFEPIKIGLYVFDGEEWSFIGTSPETEYISEIEVHRDQDGNEFHAREFGSAGVWMIENLRATKLADGTPLNNEGTTATDNVYFAFAYPNKSKEYFDTNPRIGLLYDWAAATNKKNINTVAQTPGALDGNSIEISKHKEGVHLQGICPNGWHLPTAAEWVELEKEIMKNASLYSSETTITEPTPELDPNNPYTTEGKEMYSRGTHGLAMRLPCNPPGITTDISNVTGNSTYKGGFSAYTTGLIWNNGILNYGRTASFISSSVALTPLGLPAYAGFQIEFSGKVTVYRRADNSDTGGSNAGYLSVRCKKD